MKTLIILLFSLLAGRSIGSEVEEKTNQTKPTVSECVRRKWAFWVSFFDVNGDGSVSVYDMNQARNTYSQLHNNTCKDETIRERQFSQWWTLMVLWNKREITPPEFVDLQSIAFLDDKENFVEKMRSMMQLKAQFTDVDNDGYISREEETIFMKAIGLTGKPQENEFVERLHPEGKGVPLDSLADYWVTYLTEDDCSKTDDLMDTLDNMF